MQTWFWTPLILRAMIMQQPWGELKLAMIGAWKFDSFFSVITQGLESSLGIYPWFGQKQGDTFLEKISFLLTAFISPTLILIQASTYLFPL